MTRQIEIVDKENYVPYLDHGFVGLIDHMGSDQKIEFATRMSYGEGTRPVSNTRGLLRYLIRHYHTSPIEMGEVVFHLKLPIAIMRQLVRHRTACIAGDQNLIFDAPRQANVAAFGAHPIPIKKFHDMWHYSGYGNAMTLPDMSNILDEEWYTKCHVGGMARKIEKSKLPYKILRAKNNKMLKHWKGADIKEFFSKPCNGKLTSRLAKMKLRCVDESTGNITHTNVKNVWQSGIKKVYELELDNGKKIKTSKDHLFLTNSGWQKLEDALGVKFSDSGEVKSWLQKSTFATNGVIAYQDAGWLQARIDDGLDDETIGNLASCSRHTIGKWRRIHGVKRTFAQHRFLTVSKQTGQKRAGGWKLTEDHKALLSRLRSGAGSNFWKGGVCNRVSEDITYDKKFAEARKGCFERDGYACRVTGQNGKIHAHHIIPRWKNYEKVFDVDNLITLSDEIHRKIHSNNLERVLQDYVENGKCLKLFASQELDMPRAFFEKSEYLSKKLKGRVAHNKLTVAKYVGAKSLKYVGEEMTYDIEVDGPWHNFSCEGVIVHNSLNEYSARYSELTDEFYIPPAVRLAEQSKSNKQGSGESLPSESVEKIQQIFDHNYSFSDMSYRKLLEMGLSRETARLIMPVGGYTEVVWKCDLKNFFHMVKLRTDPHAQQEIQDLGRIMYGMVTPLFPIVCEAFEDYWLNGVHLSAFEFQALKDLVAGIRSERKDFSVYDLFDDRMSKREQKEFAENLSSTNVNHR